MRYKHLSNSTLFSKVIFAAACVAMTAPISSALAVSGVSTTVEQKPNDFSTQQLLLADNDDDDDDDREVDLPESVKTSILDDISQGANVEVSTLRIVKAEKITWPNSCLGLKGGGICSQPLVPGWQVVVAGERQMWVYRTDGSGALAKLDEESTQIVNRTVTKVQSVTRQTSSRTQISAANSVAVQSQKAGFTLAILQPAGDISEVITRVSVKSKHGNKYHKERFLGDYKYKIKSKAKFVRGLKAGDRIVVRLYDTQNRFLGYSEFECLSANTMVNLILSANPREYKVVRTVYGLDANSDGMIDAGTTTYDYFTQTSGERVSFLSTSREVQVSQFQAQGLSAVAANSVYPTSFKQGEFTLVRQSINVSTANLAAALKATPGSLVSITEVSDDDSSTYDVGQLMMDYREVGVASGIQVNFDDVPANHWAKEFIAELAALEIIEGFPDGTFRPDQQLTRAQFAAMLNQAFNKVKVRSATAFKDVSTAFWAYTAIQEAYRMGFLDVAGSEFKPNDSLSRLEVLLSFAKGLNYNVSGSPEAILAAYTDAAMIRSDVRSAIAALTQRGIVVNYPDVQTLNTDKVATRAEVCALLYKALVSTGQVVDISSQYAVEAQNTEAQQIDDDDDDDDAKSRERRHCNQGIGNGAEGCDPGNSQPHGGSNDEGGRTPGKK
ncbi:S-layer homology domain-containing protein [Fischerella thermalis]|uniref:S-layer homology domain-containing protein n=1 Tax=Fischerella thermalis TaxID=372787 RepID=UPI00307E1AE2